MAVQFLPEFIGALSNAMLTAISLSKKMGQISWHAAGTGTQLPGMPTAAAQVNSVPVIRPCKLDVICWSKLWHVQDILLLEIVSCSNVT